MKILIMLILLTNVVSLRAQSDLNKKVQNYFEQNIKPVFSSKHEQNKVLEQWKIYCKEKIDSSETYYVKRSIMKLYIDYALYMTSQINNYNILSNYYEVENIYTDDSIIKYMREKAKNSKYHYGDDYYHKIISIYSLKQEIEKIREYSCLEYIENEEQYITSRINKIVKEFKEKREITKPSILFLKDLVVLSNYDTNNLYSESIIRAIKLFSDIMQQEKSAKLDYLFSDVIISKVLSANINIDVVIKTMYLLDYRITKPNEEYLTYRWSLIIDNYFNTLITPHLKKTSKEFMKIARVKQDEYLKSFELNKPINFTWTKYLYKAIENDLLEWHFYMKIK
jgi:hypothetical protein